MALPVGTVAFLFTDIEGSTRLWEKYPESMSPSLARHDSLLHDAIVGQGGDVFKTIGDAFCAVFSTVPDAVRAAIRAQRRLAKEPWPPEIELRVRIAIHAGSAEYRDGDYFGPDLNRVARLLGIGHGGQILLSQTAYDLARDHTFDGVLMIPLGEHRLRDLSRSEHVYQLQHYDLPGEFPPLRSLNHPDLPNNLPQQVTSFVGREREIREVRNFLFRSRLLTLTGSGGVGKTRLAVQVAADVMESFPDGVWYVPLAQLTDGEQLPREILTTLDLREEGGESLTDTVLEALRPRDALLLLDNCEHVIEASARLTDLILRACPNMKILATSREPLNTAGEQTYRVPSLTLPDPTRDTDPQRLGQFEAVRLFIDRAVQTRPDFTVTSTNAPALASLCARLDGIPLAIELAAARIRNLSVEEIESRLGDTFRLLTGGSRTALKRQQTLRAAIDWSYQLLSATEQTLFRRLAIFSGGWSLEAAELVAAATVQGAELQAWEMLDLLTGLSDKSLVTAESRSEGTRYRLLETVRQYGVEKLRESGEENPITEQHCDWCIQLVEQAAANLQGPEQGIWLNRLEADYDNIRAALNRVLGVPGHTEAALRLARGLRRFWGVRGYWSEGLTYLNAVFALPGADAPTAGRAEALNAAGVMAMFLGDLEQAEARLTESLELCRQLGLEAGVASAQLNLGNTALYRGELEKAIEYYEQGRNTNQLLGNRAGEAYNDQMLGRALSDLGRYSEARSHFEQALAIHRTNGDRLAEAVLLDNLAALHVRCGEYDTARDHYDRARAVAQEIGHREGEIGWLSGNGTIARRTGDLRRANEFFLQTLEEAVRTGSKRYISQAIEDLASLAAQAGEAERAARLFGFESGLRERGGYRVTPVEQKEHDTLLAGLQATLGDSTFQTLWSAGRVMGLDEALVFARTMP